MSEPADPVLGDPGETRDRLEAIWERCEGVTLGPWLCWNAFRLSGRSPLLCLTRIGPSGADGGGGILGNPDGRGADLYATEADAQFVANAREDVPWLLGEVSRLRERVKELERPAIVEKADEVALALRVLEDHDMMEEAEKLQRRASPSPAPGDQEP